MKPRSVNLQFPMGGLARRHGYQRQPPYTCPDALNVWPDCRFEGRERGGSRPGLGKVYAERLGIAGSYEVRMMAGVTVVPAGSGSNGYLNIWYDGFDGTDLGSVWSAGSWADQAPEVIEDYSELTTAEDVAAVRDAITGFDATKPYSLSIDIDPYNGGFHGTYSIYARLGTSPDVLTDGLVAALTMEADTGAYSGTLKTYVAGAVTSYNFTGGTMADVAPGKFTVQITTNTVTCYWRGTQLISQVVAAQAGSRFGFGMTCTRDNGASLVNGFEVRYYTAQPGEWHSRHQRLLVASAGGKLYREDWQGKLQLLSTSVTLNSTQRLYAQERGQKLYIADVGLRVEGGTGTIGGAGHNELSKSGVDWTDYDIDTNSDVCVLSNGSVTTDGTYKITTVASGALTLTGTPGDGTADYRIERAPKIYDPLADTLSIWTADNGGQVPTGCQLIALFRDRLVLAGDPNAPHAWFQCRQGDPLDWDYGDSAEDVGRAVAGASSDAGVVGEPVRALVPYSDDFLLYGCETSLWVQRGDIAYGGEIHNLSRVVGIMDPGAWAFGPTGEVVFISRDGLYVLPPGASSFPQSMSRELLPRELLDLDLTHYAINMAFDTFYRGVHVYVSPAATERVYGTSVLKTLTAKTHRRIRHWYVDWKYKGYWPCDVADDMEPMCILAHRASQLQNSNVLLGCRDGYIRRYMDNLMTDEGEEIPSYVFIGPLALADGTVAGLLNELTAILASGSAAADWSLRVADTAEGTITVGEFVSGTWQPGLNYTDRPRAVGGAIMLKVENHTTRPWALEAITAVIEVRGRLRKL